MKCRKCNGVGWIKTHSIKMDEVEYDRYKMCDCQKPQEPKEENDYKPSKAEWWKKYNT